MVEKATTEVRRGFLSAVRSRKCANVTPAVPILSICIVSIAPHIAERGKMQVISMNGLAR